jgi:hypothetical protein
MGGKTTTTIETTTNNQQTQNKAQHRIIRAQQPTNNTFELIFLTVFVERKK